MRILITGNMGYVGPVVVKSLRSSLPRAEIIGLDTCFFGQCLLRGEVLPETQVNTQIFKDVRDVEPELLENIDALVLLAAISNDPMGNAYEEVTADINQDACVKLARLAKEAGVGHVVFASSCSVYGSAQGGPRDERAKVNPLTAYARSKINTELSIQDLADDEFVITSLRFPTACGYSPRLRLDLVLNDFVASAVAIGRIDVLSDGTPWRPLIDVRDMARAIRWGLTRPADAGGPFLAVNVGREECNYQVRDLAEAVQQVIPGVRLAINEDAASDNRSYRVDFGQYQALAPDYLPIISLEESILSLKNGLEAAGFCDENFRESDQIRLIVLSRLRQQGLLDESLHWASV